MSVTSKLSDYAPSDLIMFKVKYRSTIKSFQIPKDMPLNEMMKFIVESFQEYTIEADKFRLGIFSGDMLVRYLSESSSFLLCNDLAVLVLSPDISSKQFVSLMACICECLSSTDRHDEVDNLSERIEETLHYLSCDEFVAHFIEHNGVKTLFNLITAINQCADLKSDLKVQLWRQTLSGLSFLISYDELILETERGVDIIDFSFCASGFDWSEVPDEVIIKILSCHSFLEDTLVFRNCLLVLLSFLKSCHNRVQLLLDNGIASFLFNALDAARPRKSLPPLPQVTSGKVSRSNSRLGNLAVRPKALSTSQSVNIGLESVPTSTRGIPPSHTSVELGKKRRRVTELQVLAVCLVHAIYEASMDSLTEALNILPPYCIASVVADLMSETESLEKSIEAMLTPQNEIRDDSSLNTSNSTATTSRSGSIFSSLKFSKSLLNPGAFSRISRMNSIGNDSQIGPLLSLAVTSQPPPPPPFTQQSVVTLKSLVDSTPIPDEKRVSVLTDPLEINLRDILINLQHFIVQPYIDLLNAQPNERQMHRALRDLCRLIRPDITTSSHSSSSGGSTEVNPKVEIYRLCGFNNPHKADDDFKIPPKMLSVVCLSSLLKYRGDLINRILDDQKTPDNLRPSCSPVIAWLEADKIGGHPNFPLMPAVRAVALILCQVLDINEKSSVEDEELNTLLFQSSPNADSVFLELFLHCFDAFYDIWFAVNAAPCDLDGIARALSTSLSNAISVCPNTFDGFARTLSNFSLDLIQKSWKMRDEEREKNHPSVQELHRDLVKQHTETVTKQRLYTMSHGQPLTFFKFTKKEVQRLCVSLSLDQNLLLVRDLQNRVVDIWPLSSILSVSSHTESKKNKSREWLVVLTIDTEQAAEQDADSLSRPSSAKQQSRHLQIVLNAPSEYIQTSWIDGFSCLRKEKFTSAAFADDVNLISNLDIRIRLFGLNLDTVPSKAFERSPTPPDLTGLLF